MGDASQVSTVATNALVTKSSAEKEPRKKKSVPFHKLFSFADPIDKLLMTLGTVAAIGHGFSRPLMAVLLGELIDAFGGSQSEGTVSRVSKVSLKLVIVACSCGVGAFLQVACWMITGQRQAARVKCLYLKAILRQEIGYFDREVSAGELIGRMASDTSLLQDAIGVKVGKFVEVVSGVLGGLAIAFVKGWLLALVLFSLLPLILVSGRIMIALRENKISKAQIAYGNAANVVHETIGSIRTTASVAGEKHAIANYKKFLTTSYKFDMGVALNNGVESGFSSFLSHCVVSLGVWFGSKLILHQHYTPGQVFSIILAVALGISSAFLRQVYPSICAFNAGQVAAFKIFQVMNRKPTIDAYDSKGKILENIHAVIEFRDIRFTYPSRPTELVFDGFSLFIPSGTTMALVGQSGSGKSTVISLIKRFYDPQSGQVLIDGIDLRGFQLKWIRSMIGLVSQEPVLFTSTIKDNISYGKEDATLEEIIDAMKLAKADDFISKLPHGLDTMVGEHGIQLSGGQKQRIAIARAIIKDPKILLLDEATSALDVNSERIVQQALDKIMVNRTTVIVAHRLSTVRNADMIAVLHKGKIVEKGTHSELLNDTKGCYATLISSQEVDDVMGQSIEQNFDTPVSVADTYETETSTICSDSASFTTSTMVNEKVASPEGSNRMQEEASFFRLINLNKPEFPVLLVATVFAIISGASPPIYALLISNVINTFYEPPQKLRKDSAFWALMLFILGIIACFARILMIYSVSYTGNKLTRRIRLKCFEKVVNTDIGWFDDVENSSGVIGSRISNDSAKIRILVGDALADHLSQATSVVVGLTVAFEASWQLSLIVLAMIPIIGFNIYLQMKSIKGLRNGPKVKYDEANQLATDAIGNTRTVSSFCAQDTILKIYKKKYEKPVIAEEIKRGLICGTGFGISVCVLYLVYSIIFYAGAKFVENGDIITADVFRVYYALAMISVVISSSSSLSTDTNKAKKAVASVFTILEKESQIDPSDDSGMTMSENFKGDIEFRSVNFSYPTRPGVEILKDFSLTIPGGKVVALVGESGSGKSTVISLLQRFYNPNSGQITLDGIEIHKYQVKWLRQQMGLVSQEPVLFNDTIQANIARGKGSEGTATETEIIAAARLANAHNFISSLQEGYDTVVGERGIQLSGGQKQRVAIARAIVKGPKILLLDEATSALDVESQKLVQEALDKVMLKTTTIIVAHRLSTIWGSDIIAVLKNGSVAEKGNHNALLRMKDGIYSSLVKSHAN